ncbi:hypothetical protein [Trichothermofontia sp.]
MSNSKVLTFYYDVRSAMKSCWKAIGAIAALSALTGTSLLLFADVASAQNAGMRGSYFGAGGAAGLTSGGAPDGNGENANFGGNLQGRVYIPNAPVSLRGAIIFSDTASQIMPLVTYDVPLSNRANLYAGGGYSFFETNKTNRQQPTPLGNDDTVVLTTGVEAAVTRDIVVYTDAKYGIDAYQSKGSGGAVSIQFGAGFRF